MPRAFPANQLRALRNDIPIDGVVIDLGVPWKISEGQFRFLCPICTEFHTATNPNTNLARCFRCRRNFNPIDLVITVNQASFVEAVHYLLKNAPRIRPPPRHAKT